MVLTYCIILILFLLFDVCAWFLFNLILKADKITVVVKACNWPIQPIQVFVSKIQTDRHTLLKMGGESGLLCGILDKLNCHCPTGVHGVQMCYCCSCLFTFATRVEIVWLVCWNLSACFQGVCLSTFWRHYSVLSYKMLCAKPQD